MNITNEYNNTRKNTRTQECIIAYHFGSRSRVRSEIRQLAILTSPLRQRFAIDTVRKRQRQPFVICQHQRYANGTPLCQRFATSFAMNLIFTVSSTTPSLTRESHLPYYFMSNWPRVTRRHPIWAHIKI